MCGISSVKSTILNNLDVCIDETIIYSDSKVVLGNITYKSRGFVSRFIHCVYVGNRVDKSGSWRLLKNGSMLRQNKTQQILPLGHWRQGSQGEYMVDWTRFPTHRGNKQKYWTPWKDIPFYKRGKRRRVDTPHKYFANNLQSESL